MALALGINGLAYLLLAFYWWRNPEESFRELTVPFAIVGLIFTLHLAFLKAKGWKNPVTYALGNLLSAVPALFAPAIAGKSFTDKVLEFWFLLAYYEAIGAAYVETKLAFRRFPRKYPLIAWIPAFFVVLYNPYLIIALIEPTVRLIRNLKDNTYVTKIEDIKRLGWSVFRSVMLLYVLTLAILYFT